MGFEIFGTAGDAGLKAEAAGLDALLGDLALGFSELSSGGAIKPLAARTFSLEAGSPQALLVNFLNELVFLSDTEGFLPAAAEIRTLASDGGYLLEASLKGETAVFDRHPRGLLVKAATYHKLKVENTNGRWRAEVILDI